MRLLSLLKTQKSHSLLLGAKTQGQECTLTWNYSAVFSVRRVSLTRWSHSSERSWAWIYAHMCIKCSIAYVHVQYIMYSGRLIPARRDLRAAQSQFRFQPSCVQLPFRLPGIYTLGAKLSAAAEFDRFNSIGLARDARHFFCGYEMRSGVSMHTQTQCARRQVPTLASLINSTHCVVRRRTN